MVYFNKDLLPVDEINPMWKSLNTAERMYLRENAKYEEFKRGSIIYREGAAPTHMYCLISGKVKIFRDFVGGRSQLVRIIGPGESFAYRAYFAGENFMTSAAAVDNSEAYSLPLTVVGQILKSNNSLAVEFIKLLSRDLDVLGNGGREPLQVGIDGGCPVEMIEIKHVAISPRADADARDVTCLYGVNRLPFRPLRLEVNAGMEMIVSQFSKVPA